MAYSTDYENFIDSYNIGNVDAACGYLSAELGKLVVTRRGDFVTLLNQNGIPTNVTVSDGELIDLFVNNVGTNKELCIGAALLVSMNNKKAGADGEEELNNEAVRAGYDALQERHSYFGPLGGALLKGASNAANNIIKNTQAKKAQAGNAETKRAMELAAKKKREAIAKAAAEKKRNQNIIIVSTIIGSAALIAILAYTLRK